MTISDISDFFKLYGFQGGGLLVVVVVAWHFLKTDWFSRQIVKLFNKLIGKKNKDVNKSSIINHNIFNYIDFWVYSKVPVMKFSTEYRTIIFRKYLTILLMKYRDDIHKYIASNVYEKMDESELWKSVLSLIHTIIYDYEKEMDSMGIPHIIVNMMKEKNNESISLIVDLTESVCSCEFYESSNNYLKIYSIMNLIMAVLQSVINNAIITSNAINGGLEGLYVDVDGRRIVERKIEH
jgi:two-component SAPR family response regulator